MATLEELKEKAKSWWEDDPALKALDAIPDRSIRRLAYQKFVEGKVDELETLLKMVGLMDEYGEFVPELGLEEPEPWGWWTDNVGLVFQRDYTGCCSFHVGRRGWMLEYEFDFDGIQKVVARTTVPLSGKEFWQIFQEETSDLMYHIRNRSELLEIFEQDPAKARESYHWKLTGWGLELYPDFQEAFDADADEMDEYLRERLWEFSPGYWWRVRQEWALMDRKAEKEERKADPSKGSQAPTAEDGARPPQDRRQQPSLTLPLDGELAVAMIRKFLLKRAEGLEQVAHCTPASQVAHGFARLFRTAVEELRGVKSLREAKPILQRCVRKHFSPSQLVEEILDQIEVRLGEKGGEGGGDEGEGDLREG